MKARNRHAILAATILICFCVIIAASAPTCASSTRKPLTLNAIAALALKSVVSLTVLGADGNTLKTGSGFVIGKNVIVTNVHVIKGAHAVTANYTDGTSRDVLGLLGFDKDRDLAILYSDTSGEHPVHLGDSSRVRVGDRVVAVGSPEGLTGSVTNGIISGIRVVGDTKLFQTTAPISPGSSGGPLINEYGEVIGVTSFQLVEGQNLNFAYASGHIGTIQISDPHDPSKVSQWADLAALGLGDDQSPALPTSSSIAKSADADIPYTTKPLKGIVAVSVLIEDLNDEAKAAGLDEDVLKTDVELRLRKDGIKVSSEDFSQKVSQNSGYVYVQITTLALQNGDLIFNHQVSFNEDVQLRRAAPIICTAHTWDRGGVAFSPADGFAHYVRDVLGDDIDKFANEMLAQNTP
ncbi:MAG: trypsin-like peptidase domain-containing protein [Capsulimonadaceae bacterium]|nr:trypsin-like peptidase domain-containing protein [Capsulimonadaceae bacterium]